MLLTWKLRRELPQLPETLDELANVAILRGDLDAASALSGAAESLRRENVTGRRERVRAAVDASKSEHLPPLVAEWLSRILDEGRDNVLANARAALPPDIAGLLGVAGVSSADVAMIHSRTGAVTAADFAHAISLGWADASGLHQASRRIEAALPHIRVGQPRIPLGRAVSVVERVHEAASHAVPAPCTVEATGSVRRFEPTVGDVDIIIGARGPETVLEATLKELASPQVLHRSRTVACLTVDGQPVTLRAMPDEAVPGAQVFLTGTPQHVAALQARAVARGWRLSPTGLQPGPSVALRTESEVYAALGCAFHPPELRHDGELLDADRGVFPHLLTQADIRGDLHVHTLWSDGRDSVESMVRAARQLGYEYVAITDHSERAAASRVLTVEKLERQGAEIERLQSRFPDIRILKGVEVDILPDGTLDFPDSVLERLDIVLASLHEPAGQGPDLLLRRYLKAMEHPLVDVITHPANRLVGRHDGYALDFEALFTAAVRTGTVLEVDGGPTHLDMDGELARRAVAAGVLVSVDSDCHNSARLERQMRLGVGTARRGGLQPQHVLNTRPLPELLSGLSKRRTRV